MKTNENIEKNCILNNPKIFGKTTTAKFNKKKAKNKNNFLFLNILKIIISKIPYIQ